MKSLLTTLLIAAILCASDRPLFAQVFNDVLILDENEPLPPNTKKTGSIKVGDGFRTNCGYAKTMGIAREKALEAGGNVLKITQLKHPDGWSTCYRVKADVYVMDDIQGYLAQQERTTDSLLNVILPDTASYGLLFVYRPVSSLGSVVQYNLHVDDKKVCRVKNGSKHVIKLYNRGVTKIWARTEARDEVIVDVAPGKVCFLRCSVGMGAFVGQPRLELVSAYEGLKDFNPLDNETTDAAADSIYK